MPNTKSGETPIPTETANQLNERELDQAVGGLFPAVGPAAKSPAPVEQDLIGLL